MLTQDFINTALPLLTEKQTVKEALRSIKEHHLQEITACINGNYGFFSYNTLHLLPADTPLHKVERRLHKATLSSKTHIWESLRALSQHDTEVMPLLDENHVFCGAIVLRDIFNRITEVFPIGNGGAILELEMSFQHYSIQELGSIVESTGAKITLLSTFPIAESTKINLVFCIDKNDASEVIQALERHSYHVNAWFMNKGKIDTILEERYDAFMKYINV